MIGETVIVDYINRYLTNKGIRFATEIKMGIGIPDIVFCLSCQNGLPHINDYYEISLLKYLHSNPKISIENLSSSLNYNPVSIKKYLIDLEYKGIITLKNSIVNLNKDVFKRELNCQFAIEAKLHDWKSGIIQAERYLIFADYSYLAMPQQAIKSIDLSKLSEKGIGLLSITEKNLVEILPPQRSICCDDKLKYMVQSEIYHRMPLKKHLRPNIFSDKCKIKSLQEV